MKRSIASNLGWLLLERVVVTLLVFVANLYVIRYLGAERFGMLALFQVWLALTLTGTDFGLRRVFLALARSRAIGLVLGATVRVKLAVGTSAGTVLALALWAFEAPPQYWLLLSVLALAPLEAYVYHFEAQLRNDLLARIRITLALAMAGARVGLCVGGAGVAALAVTYVLPSLLLWTTCRVLARGHTRPVASSARQDAVSGHVLRRAGFFFGSMVLVQLHARIAQLLLAAFADRAELGYYAGAFKFIEQLALLPAMVSSVLLPALSRGSSGQTAHKLEAVYFAAFLASLALAAGLVLTAPTLIALTLGPGFAPAAPVLAVLACGVPAVFLANLSGLFYSLERMEHWALLRNFAGLAVGLALGLVLIPRHGALGAAWSMVASYAFVAFAVEWCSPHLRRNALIKLRAFGALFSPRGYGALFARMGGHDASR